MSGFGNDSGGRGVVYSDNVDFSGSLNPQAQVLADGQLLIGSSVSPNIRVNTLTPGTGVSISNGNGTITIGLTGGAVAIEHIQGDSGTVSGQTVSFQANTGNGNAGSTVKFSSSTATQMNLTLSNAALSNTIIGNGAGNQTISGAANVGVGTSTLQSLTSGTFNCGIGVGSLQLTTSGQLNTCMGYATGIHITTGSDNTAVGANALNAVVSTSDNTAVGNSAGILLTGSQNTFLGAQAGTAIVSGSGNTLIGYLAGLALATGTESNNIIIGNSGTINDSNVIRIGTQGSGAGQQNKCFIAGIASVAVSNLQYATINTSTGQLGSTAIFKNAYVQTAISYQVLVTDSIVGVTSNAAARTVTMPNSGMTVGQVWTIKDEAGTAQSANNITVSGNGVNIDGAATFVINTNFGSIDLYWNGTQFFAS